MEKFEGTFVVAVTPFKSDEELDLEALEANVDYYIENGVHGVVVGGSTGEFASLTLQEHKKIIKFAVDRVNGRVPVIAGTGACTTRRVIALTKYAKDIGADGAMIIPPFYTKPNENELFEHFKNISEAVKNLPIMLYNNPWTSKVDMQPTLIVKLAEIDNIRYVKESSGDATRVWKIINLTRGKMTVFCGADNLALESFLMGAKGWICVAANIFPKYTSRLYELAKENDIEKARALYSELLPLLNFLEETGKFTQLSKAGLEILGRKAGPPRKPLLPANVEEKQELKDLMKKIQSIEL